MAREVDGSVQECAQEHQEHSAVHFTLLQPSVKNNRLVQVIEYSLEANQSHNRLLGATSVEGPVG